MKQQYIPGRPRGYILLPVVLLISLVAAAAFMLNNESVLETGVAVSSVNLARADYVSDAGLQHAMWQVKQAGCGPYTDISAEAFGNHSYSATIIPNNAGGAITTYTVSVSDDAYIREDQPTNNYGNDAKLEVYQKWFASEGHRALYRYDIAASGIPAGALVVSAVAKIFVVTPDPSNSVTVHKVTTDWTEAAANWGNITADSSSIASIASNPSAGQYVDVNITTLVRGWISGSITNQGIMLKSGFFSNKDLSEYTSKEYSTTSERPYLEIKVVDGSLSNRVDISVIGTLAGGISSSMAYADISLYQPPLSITVQPDSASGKDAEIWDQQPNNNYGNAAETWVSSASNDKTRSLLHFNMNAIPVGAKIQSATLSLLRQSGSGANQPVSAHRIKNPWSEDSVTWNSREAGTSWDTAGSDFDSMAVVTTPVGPANQRYEWNITPLVQSWVDGSFQNHGVVLAAAITGMSGERFYTSDDSDPTRHPRLTISYTCQCGITCQLPQGSGSILLVVGDDVTLASDDVKKQAFFETWGYTINLIDDGVDQTTFDAALARNDVAYISATVSPWTLADKLVATGKGVVNEESGQNDNLGLSSSGSNTVSDSMEIIDNSHYITALFSNSVLPIFNAPMEAILVTGTAAAGLQTLGSFFGSASLALVDVGGVLGGDRNGENAAGRRVAIPIGSSDKFNWDYLNNNGHLIVQRAIQWGIDGGSSIPPPKKIYWTDDNGARIQRSDEDGSNVETIVSGEVNVRGLDIDTVNGKIYWTRDTEIRRADIDGSNIETIYSGSLVNLDVKLDVAAGKMYWSHDNGNDQVMRADLDGNNSETINSSFNDPAYMSLDTADGKLYITEFATGNVNRINLDGSSSTTLTTGPNGAVGNALDIAGGKVYWSGGASNDWIKRANLDGSNEETIITGLNAPQDIVYDADNDRIYWTDALAIPSIKRANADGSNVETIVNSGLNRPRGIVIVDANLVSPTGGATGLIAHWKLDETSGNTALDSVGGHNGTLAGNPTWSTGTLGGALDFDGAGDHVDVGPILDSGTPQISVTAWIFKRDTGDERVITKASGTARSDHIFSLGVANTTIRVRLRTTDNGGTSDYDGGTISLNQWVHLAFAYDDGTLRIYKNGTEAESYAVTGDMIASTLDVVIANVDDSNNRYWNGLLDDVRIYDRALDTAEIVELANGGGGGSGSGSGSGDCCDGDFRDEFNAKTFSGDDGSLNWADDWQEVGESNGAASGDVRVADDQSYYQLRIRDNNNGGEGVARAANLTGAVTATLSFDYRRMNLDNSNDYVTVYASLTGTDGPWTELDVIGTTNDSSYQPYSRDISAFISEDTAIRLRSSPIMGNSDTVWFDNVQIECSP